jgi:hypothetical protein
MAAGLTRCEVCGGEVARRARTCPHCGIGRLPAPRWVVVVGVIVGALIALYLLAVWLLFICGLSMGPFFGV